MADNRRKRLQTIANGRKPSQMVASRRKRSQMIGNGHKHIALLLTAHLLVCVFSASILQAVKHGTLTQCRAIVGPPSTTLSQH